MAKAELIRSLNSSSNIVCKSEEQVYRISPIRCVTPSDDIIYVTYALSPLTAEVEMTLSRGDGRKP